MSSRVYLLFPPRGHEQNKTTYYEVEYTVVLVFNIDEWLIYGGARAIRQSIPYSYVLLIFYCTIDRVGLVVVVVVVVFTLKTVLTSIQYPSLSYSSRQINEFPWSHANPN